MPTARPTAGPRLLAWRILCRWERGGVFAESLIRHAEQGLSPADRAMLQAIVLTTLRHLRLLEHTLTDLRGGKPLQPDARWLILTGLCQLFPLQWPEYAVVNELVALAPARLRGLVNGILREALRRRPLIESAQLPPGVRYSMPDWLVERWEARLGRAECLALLEWMGHTPPVCFRINPLCPPADIPADWQPLAQAEGWYSATEGGLPLRELKAGHIYAADPSTRHSVQLLAPQPGERILDTCAAPGGKSSAILGATLGKCSLLSTDALAHRLPTLRENLRRCGAQPSSFRIEQHDWLRPCPAKWKGSFHAVLADVPCSNSGVFQRRVDARWRLTPEELIKLTHIQQLIATHAMQAVRPGGRFVYSTCSIEPEENTLLVQELLRAHPGWKLEQEILALPHRVQSDGAYAALLRAPEEA